MHKKWSITLLGYLLLASCSVQLGDFYEWNYSTTQSNASSITYPTSTHTNNSVGTFNTSTTESTHEPSTVPNTSTTVNSANQPPTVTILTPLPNESVKDSFVIMGSATDDGGVALVEIILDSQEPVRAQGAYQWSYAFNNLLPGTHTLQIKVTDNQGLTSTEERTIQVATETLNPEIYITSHTPNEWIPKDFTLSGTATDNVTLDKIEIQWDDGTYQTASGTETWFYDFADLAEGTHFFVVKAYDSAGNTSVEGIHLQVDRTIPTLVIDNPLPFSDVTGIIGISGTSDDASESGIAKVEVKIDAAGTWEEATGLENWGYNWDTTGLSIADYTIYARATDAAGNVSAEQTIQVHKTNDWEPYFAGSINVGSAGAHQSSIAHDGNSIYIAFLEEHFGAMNVYVRACIHGGWSFLGGPINVDQGKDASAVSIYARNDEVYVAWAETDGSVQHIYVAKWTGTMWEYLAGSLNAHTTRNAYDPSISICPDSTPYPVVAFSNYDGSYNHIYVKKWTGSSWVSIGSNVDTYRQSGHPDLIFINTTPYVAFFTTYSCCYNYAVSVHYWNGNSWPRLGGYVENSNSDRYRHPKLTVDPSDTLYITYRSQLATKQIFVEKYNAGSWVNVGGALNINTAYDAVTPSITYGNGKPYVSFAEQDGTAYQMYVREYSGASWNTMNGGTSLNVDAGQDASNPCIVYTDAMLLLSFDEAASPSAVYIKNY